MILDEKFFNEVVSFQQSFEALSEIEKSQLQTLMIESKLELDKISKIIYVKDKILNIIYK